MVRESTAASALAALARCAASFLPPPVDRLCHDPLGARLAGYGRAAALLEAWPGAARALLSAGGWGGPLGRAAADAALTAAAACRLLDDEVLRWAEAGERQGEGARARERARG